MPMPVAYSARAAMRRCNAALSVPARARSVLNASSSTLNVSASDQPWRNASATGCMATGVAWIRAIRFGIPVSSLPQELPDRGAGAVYHSPFLLPSHRLHGLIESSYAGREGPENFEGHAGILQHNLPEVFWTQG